MREFSALLRRRPFRAPWRDRPPHHHHPQIGRDTDVYRHNENQQKKRTRRGPHTKWLFTYLHVIKHALFVLGVIFRPAQE